MIADSPAKPRVQFTLQTNGTLLHRHDYAKMRAAGMTDLQVSVDSAEPETQKILRNGTSLKKWSAISAAFGSLVPIFRFGL